MFGESAGETGASRELASEWRVEALETFRTNLKLMVAAEKVLGCKVYIAKQATLIVPDLAPELRRHCGYGLHGLDHEAHVSAYEAVYRVIDEEVAPSRIIDTRSLSGNPKMLQDHVHLRIAGAAKVAEIVSEKLIEGFASPSPPK